MLTGRQYCASHRAGSSGTSSRSPCPWWVWKSCPQSQWWTHWGDIKETNERKDQLLILPKKAINCNVQPARKYYEFQEVNLDKAAIYPFSLRSFSCSVIKHSSQTARYSIAILASFLYALPMAPLFGSNWTTFTTLCETVKESANNVPLNSSTIRNRNVSRNARIWVPLRVSQQPEGLWWHVHGTKDRNMSDQHSLRSQSIPETQNNTNTQMKTSRLNAGEDRLSLTYIRGFGLSIPAVAGIVGHLIIHMLTETKLVFCHAHFDQIKVDPCNKVAQDRVVDNSL